MLLRSALALLALISAEASAAESMSGKIVELDAAKSRMKIGGADIRWKDLKVEGFKVGDEVTITYTQEDVHEPYILLTITRK